MIIFDMPDISVSRTLACHCAINLDIKDLIEPLYCSACSSAFAISGKTNSVTTALNKASLLSKYRYNVPFETPASLATLSNLVAANPLSENAFNAARPILKQMLIEMRQLPLDGQFLIDMSDYYIEEIQTPPLPESVTAAMPNTQTITQGQNILNQAMNAGTTQNGLTATENAFLSEEEKMMRLKNRGMMA